MQPIRLVVSGSFWDSYIYAGRLYLFRVDGSLSVINYDTLIESLTIISNERLVITCALMRGDYLYGPEWSLVFGDEDVKGLIVSKFDSVSKHDISVSNQDLSSHIVRTQNVPFPFPFSDLTIYNRMCYSASGDGIFAAEINRRAAYPMDRTASRLWDSPVLSLAASYGNLAIAAGSEGLYDLALDDDDDTAAWRPGNDEPRQLATSSATKCSWLRHSVFSTSFRDDATLAEFSKRGDDDLSSLGVEDIILARRDNWGVARVFEGLRDAHAVFGRKGTVVGAYDKMYLIANQKLLPIRYQPWRDDHRRFQYLDESPISADENNVINGTVTHFGIVIERTNDLMVICSDGSEYISSGEPVNWRVFPRAEHYRNHLHVVYEDRLEILSFNHDYFLDQAAKTIGAQSYLSRSRSR